MEYITNINFASLFTGLYNLIPSKKKTYSQEDMAITIEKLNNIQNNIATRINSISTNIGEFLLKSKRYYKEGNKKSAVYNLKLKKMYEREKEKLESINFNIESQIFSIESMGLIIETAETLKDTSTHMKNINNKLDIDKIESTMEELQEHHDINQELQNIFSDEDELLKELEGDTYIPPITVDKTIIASMPIAPSTELPHVIPTVSDPVVDPVVDPIDNNDKLIAS